jgi:cobalt-zinc-cadmium efflux system membrane fusion protein
VEGTVSLIAAAVDPATHTVQVRITVKGDQAALKPGMSAEAEFDQPVPADAEPVIAVPEEAVQTIDGKPVVFMPDDEEPNTFVKRVVVVGTPSKGKIPILYGVNPKDKVVVTGSFILKAQLGKPAAD